MKKYFILSAFILALVGFAQSALYAQLEPPPHKLKKKTEKSRLDKMGTVSRHTRKNKKGMTKAEIRRRSTMEGQARRRYKISQGRTGGLTKASRRMKRRKQVKRKKGMTRAAMRMSNSERKRKRSLRRKLKRIN
ncbi:hypothetical protein [uncultured Microscilla sp.]|uniref:hypothetical protein n=1 Tax=uncultured Microscilla sp. TaxID=432653 RepID=UPI0026079B5E|nr:hypothetical protein [uncultured Microscilla sp.]